VSASRRVHVARSSSDESTAPKPPTATHRVDVPASITSRSVRSTDVGSRCWYSHGKYGVPLVSLLTAADTLPATSRVRSTTYQVTSLDASTKPEVMLPTAWYTYGPPGVFESPAS